MGRYDEFLGATNTRISRRSYRRREAWQGFVLHPMAEADLQARGSSTHEAAFMSQASVWARRLRRGVDQWLLDG